MSMAGRALRIAGRALNPAYRLTPARKRALAKAVKASAAARRGKGKAGLGRKIVRYGERIQGVSTTNFRATARVKKMGLKKNFFGMAKGSNFKNRAARKASYADRLNAGRQSFREKSFARRYVRNVLGKRYDTLTFGENFRRNIARHAKVGVASYAVAATVAGGVYAGSKAAQGVSQAAKDVQRQINNYRNDRKHRGKK